ncbi:MAG: hypothetical protein A3H69_05690 [Candidatus Sungbacteria bacterium RIFCSPLOWO2_02_FULL_47_9]|uniref:Uncharacterized protein n=1 Tax=Candidatus Sungbacteria bacterium RIFCSPHIGHO2_01_FULL_47_32 TaxID=1802264 RepID=A0A1G2K8L3_9BACT|nr:MAG: hypothetical protein UX72_C0004G0059 [Parcubacteria group bacterium GW2011_GWA2_47_10]OGZ95772.1 MAG: hypothetical protein A2633_00565 [Candidatus Sungbacteria bacterium RIFCSPHIGHO2_01_FULL_47_32]OGZ99087.1 MAG: hypothetical protein A3D57_03490 [Candidatus Sungbacteria bacterium RIFCSPHIGHO2_02_FULL_46_12]OHA04579.1 MAG: hypothetical protein A3A28_01310 [Candidatus Sungbacteria bacterium RIFCSPLOWO2_01_FULL_47_32]OHA10124.1 MAG: hypothetical protein A3H69_05690 [Candidatus Sungbacteria
MHQNASLFRISTITSKSIQSFYGRPPEPSKGLFSRIMARIRAERDLLMLKRRVAFFCVAMAGFCAAIVPVFGLMRSELARSSFGNLLSLLYSDPDFVIDFWGDYGLSLLESLPTASIAAFFATVFVFLGLLKLMMRDTESIFSYSKFLKNV